MPPKINNFSKTLQDHIDKENKCWDNITNDIRSLKENHLAHIETDIQSLKIQGIALSTDMGWVKKSTIGIISGIGAIFITLVAGAIVLAYSIK